MEYLSVKKPILGARMSATVSACLSLEKYFCSFSNKISCIISESIPVPYFEDEEKLCFWRGKTIFLLFKTLRSQRAKQAGVSISWVSHVRLHNMSPIYIEVSLCILLFSLRYPLFPVFFYVFPWFPMFFYVFSWFSPSSPVSPCFSMFFPDFPCFSMFSLILPVLPCFSTFYPVFPCFSMFFLDSPCFPVFFYVFLWFSPFSRVYLCFQLILHVFPCFSMFSPDSPCFSFFCYVFPWFSLFFLVFLCFPLILPVFSWFSTFSSVSPCFSGKYKSRTGSTRTASPGRINSDRLGPTRIEWKNKNKIKLDSDQLGAIKKIKLNQQNWKLNPFGG